MKFSDDFFFFFWRYKGSHIVISALYSGNSLTDTFENSVDLDEMPQNVAFHQGLHCLLR